MAKLLSGEHPWRGAGLPALPFAAPAVVALLLSARLCAPAQAADWPPLNPRIERRSHTERVDGVDFWTGYYSYWVPHYHVDSLHQSRTVNEGPRSWHAEFGPGLPDITSGQVGGSSAGGGHPTAAQPPLPPLPPVKALPALSTLPPVPSPPPAPAANLPALPALSPLPSLPPLPN